MSGGLHAVEVELIIDQHKNGCPCYRCIFRLAAGQCHADGQQLTRQAVHRGGMRATSPSGSPPNISTAIATLSGLAGTTGSSSLHGCSTVDTSTRSSSSVDVAVT